MKDLRQVNARLTVCQRELRANQVTTAQIQPLPAETTTYRALGKCFMHTPRKEVDRRLSSELESLTKTQSDLTDRKQYLERRIESNAQHMKDIVNQ
jgi:prefoldin subunit 1